MAIKNGDKVKVEYTGTFDDGTVFDSSEKHGKPLEFQVGGKQVVPGFENAVVGMEKEQEKEIKLQPSEAYGDPNPQLVKKVPKDKMPKDVEVKPGMVMVMSLPNGMQVPATVKEISDADVTIDLNHPLAGKILNFKIKIVDVA